MDAVEATNHPLQRNVEIFHFDEYDAIVNRRFKDQEKVNTLLETVKSGIPVSWTRIDTKKTDGAELYQDQEINPKFVAKIKRWTEEARAALLEPDTTFRQVYSAFQSIANEIELAPSIQEIVTGDEAQRIAGQNGLAGIKYVEPILGIIERNTGRKVLFYEHQEGISADELKKLADAQQHPRVNLYNFTTELEKLFNKHGIGSYDLVTPPKDGKNFIFGNNDDKIKTAHLIDTEAYTKKKSAIKAKLTDTTPGGSQ